MLILIVGSKKLDVSEMVFVEVVECDGSGVMC